MPTSWSCFKIAPTNLASSEKKHILTAVDTILALQPLIHSLVLVLALSDVVLNVVQVLLTLISAKWLHTSLSRKHHDSLVGLAKALVKVDESLGFQSAHSAFYRAYHKHSVPSEQHTKKPSQLSSSSAEVKMTAGQKTVDPAEVKMETAAVAGKTAGAGIGMGKLIIIGLCVLFVIGNVTALYVLHFVNRPSPTTRFTFNNFAATPGTTAHEGDAVSFNASSVLRNGAGTTAYLNSDVTLEAGATATYGYMNYLSLSAMGTTAAYYTTNLMTYVRLNAAKSAMESVLTTATFDPEAKGLTVAAVTDTNTLNGYKITDVVTLSDTLAVALALTQGAWSSNGYAVPISIEDTTPTLLSSKKNQFTSTSGSNTIGALSASTFVVAYYDDYLVADYKQFAKVGVVGNGGTITYSAAKEFGVSNTVGFMNFGAPRRVPSTSSFIIPYYRSTTNSTIATGLCVTSSTFTTSTSTLSDFSDGVCQTSFVPSNFVDSVFISDTAMAIIFYDMSNNNALTVATVTYSTTDGSLSFHSSFVFADVGGNFDWGEDPYGFSVQPTMRVLNGNRLAVSFFNPSQTGKYSVKILRFSPSTLTFREATPVMPVSAFDFTLTTTHDYTASSGAYLGGVTADLVPVSADGVMVGYITHRDLKQAKYFSVVEAFGEPVGILRDYNGKGKATVAVSGKAKVKGLSNGVRYYATTSGSVVAASTDSDTPSNSTDFFYASGDGLLVTADSLVGLAVDSDQLFVSKSV